jgi:hypothetical protein
VLIPAQIARFSCFIVRGYHKNVTLFVWFYGATTQFRLETGKI